MIYSVLKIAMKYSWQEHVCGGSRLRIHALIKPSFSHETDVQIRTHDAIKRGTWYFKKKALPHLIQKESRQS